MPLVDFCEGSIFFRILMLFYILFASCSPIYALTLENIKANFLNADYKAVISGGEKLLAGAHSSSGLDELYYLLGLSYLKEGNYLRSADIFEIILNEFEHSRFKDEARMGLADAFFIMGEFDKADSLYKESISINPDSKFKAQAYWRLSQIAFKKSDTQQASFYLQKIKAEFPLCMEVKLSGDNFVSGGLKEGLYYTVQVGSFVKEENAKNLLRKLSENGYPAYLEEIDRLGKVVYRVRVGRFAQRKDAEALETRLSQEGYPTRICP